MIKIISIIKIQEKHGRYSIYHKVDPSNWTNKLSNADSWREVHEENEATPRPRLQDISTN